MFIIILHIISFIILIVLFMEKILVLKFLVTSSFCHFMFMTQIALGY